MNELQGAVGLAQLRKLTYVINAQRKIYNKIWNQIKGLNGIEKRYYSKDSYISADALIIMVKNKKLAKKCRSKIIKI